MKLKKGAALALVVNFPKLASNPKPPPVVDSIVVMNHGDGLAELLSRGEHAQ